MANQEPVFDSPKGWVARHINDYVETDGRKGHLWQGAPTLLVTTRGRKTGKLRRTALIYGRDGDSYVVVGSEGGAKKHPLWYLNLRAEPKVDVQVGPDLFSGRARTANQEERARFWPRMAEIWPDYNNYQKRTSREIPLVIIEPN